MTGGDDASRPSVRPSRRPSADLAHSNAPYIRPNVFVVSKTRAWATDCCFELVYVKLSLKKKNNNHAKLKTI